jgi:hypothetical protein
MDHFSNAREAKEFLVSRIVQEAQQEGVSLSEVERKMLYFTETAWTLPDIMEVSDEFDRTYDQGEYEQKIAGLVRNAGKRAQKENREEYGRWWDAIRVLSKEDHYVLVMIRRAGLRRPGDALRLWGTGFAIVTAFCLATFISLKFNIEIDKYVPSRNAFYFYVWAAMASAVIGYTILRVAWGAQRTDDLVNKLLRMIFRIPKREK